MCWALTAMALTMTGELRRLGFVKLLQAGPRVDRVVIFTCKHTAAKTSLIYSTSSEHDWLRTCKCPFPVRTSREHAADARFDRQRCLADGDPVHGFDAGGPPADSEPCQPPVRPAARRRADHVRTALRDCSGDRRGRRHHFAGRGDDDTSMPVIRADGRWRTAPDRTAAWCRR